MKHCLRPLATLLLLLTAGARAAAPLPPDPAGLVAELPVPAPAHWIWVNDFVFPHMTDGQALLVDGDTGRYLGQLSTGFAYARIVPAKDGRVLYSPETYFARGTRGTRTDVVTLYDPAHLAPVGEIVIPPKRSANLPMMGNAELTDDGRFLLVYNFDPAQSVSVIDTRSRSFAGEVFTPGCALVFPTGPRGFFSICGDGTLLEVALDDAGKGSTRRTARVFDVARDPATEKGVRVGDRWYFVTFAGSLVSIDAGAGGLHAGPAWPLASAAEVKDGWRPGGLQQLAVHAGLGRLWTLMHRGGPETHKDPGSEAWVYDLRTRQRIQRLALAHPTGSIQVSRDERPLLFGAFIDSTTLDVYDATSGRHLRSVENLGTTPTLLVNP